ncbi:MAG TPA: T9SS type A sorting domain-containing protein [Bacteroidota bacterium]|nr:T9SS type A sorting domain-containing protein [Bacteroidota bacterium]
MSHTTGVQALVLLIVGMPAYLALAQWVPTAGLPGGSAYCFAVEGNLQFAGTEAGGIFRSSDSGRSWTRTAQSATSAWVSSFAISGRYLLVGTAGGGVLRSGDGGDDWHPVNAGLANLAVSALDTCRGVVFASTMDGIYRSSDSGETWGAVDSGLTNTSFTTLKNCGGTIFAGTWSNGVFRSTNGGESWIPANAGLPATHIDCFAADGLRIYLGTFGAGLFRSTNNGVTWGPADTGISNPVIEGLGVGVDEIFAGTSSGLFVSRNGGDSWAAGGFPGLQVCSFLIDSTGVRAGLIDGGIYESSDGGATWVPGDSGFAGTAVATLATNGSAVFAGTSTGDVCRTNDRGIHWARVFSWWPTYYVNAIAVNGDHVYAGSFGVIVSSDSGKTWSEPNYLGLTETRALASLGSYVFAGLRTEGVFRSSDYGTHWSPSSAGLSDLRITAFQVVDGQLFAATQGGLFRSTDLGANWTERDTGIGVRNFNCLGTDDSLLYVGASGGGVFASPDKGGTWYQANPLFEVASLCNVSGRAGHMFAATKQGVCVSTNAGVTWSPVNTGLPDVQVESILVSNGTLFAGTQSTSRFENGAGVWSRPLSDILTAIPLGEAAAPPRYSLDQNYPNPFNPSTTIRYVIANREHVTLEVFNVLGARVALLIDRIEDPGPHFVIFDATGLATGAYFLRLTSGGKAMVRKMLSVR